MTFLGSWKKMSGIEKFGVTALVIAGAVILAKIAEFVRHHLALVIGGAVLAIFAIAALFVLLAVAGRRAPRFRSRPQPPPPRPGRTLPEVMARYYEPAAPEGGRAGEEEPAGGLGEEEEHACKQ